MHPFLTFLPQYIHMEMGLGLSLTLQQRLELRQNLELKHELKQELVLSQKLTLELLLKMQEFFEGLYEMARQKDRLVIYDKHGLQFEYALIRKSWLPTDIKEWSPGFAILYSNIIDVLFGGPGYALTFVVEDSMKPFPKEYRDLVAVHEYGESLFIGHDKASIVEWNIAKKEGLLDSYIPWLEEHFPSKLCDLYYYSLLYDSLPDDFIDDYEKQLEGRRSDVKEALMMIAELGMPHEVGKANEKFMEKMKTAMDMIMKYHTESANLIRGGSGLSIVDSKLVAAYVYQNIAREFERQNISYMAGLGELNNVWMDMRSKLSMMWGDKVMNTKKVYFDLIHMGVELDENSQAVLSAVQEPFGIGLPDSLRFSLMLERELSPVLKSENQRDILSAYIKLAGQIISGKLAICSIEKVTDEFDVGKARFAVQYALLSAIGAIAKTDDNLDEGYWRKQLKRLDKRFSKRFSGELFQKGSMFSKDSLSDLRTKYKAVLARHAPGKIIKPNFQRPSDERVKSFARSA